MAVSRVSRSAPPNAPAKLETTEPLRSRSICSKSAAVFTVRIRLVTPTLVGKGFGVQYGSARLPVGQVLVHDRGEVVIMVAF